MGERFRFGMIRCVAHGSLHGSIACVRF
jgi:hypothetical protein